MVPLRFMVLQGLPEPFIPASPTAQKSASAQSILLPWHMLGVLLMLWQMGGLKDHGAAMQTIPAKYCAIRL